MTDHNTLLNSLTDEELLRHFRAEHDPMTSTPIADELAKRFEVLLDHRTSSFTDVLDEFDAVTPGDLRSLLESHPETMEVMTGLLSTLNDGDVHTVEALKNLIEINKKFRALASDAGDVFAKLNELITTTQE